MATGLSNKGHLQRRSKTVPCTVVVLLSNPECPDARSSRRRSPSCPVRPTGSFHLLLESPLYCSVLTEKIRSQHKSIAQHAIVWAGKGRERGGQARQAPLIEIRLNVCSGKLRRLFRVQLASVRKVVSRCCVCLYAGMSRYAKVVEYQR